ncbi:DUF4307 domain-containing protein [Jiangella asiatica]|uniref:DUF4307 domain-containing protein n=1 Tax=Jiangella asiatica TaxID=2530372 RepID=A0A4R5D6I0_9ACTN|nr:DUF4307 domain-containing protein [Jiangella asiatica]TDE09112.1 DUF4307 domain-containing protein [Jiangella asiatica]
MADNQTEPSDLLAERYGRRHGRGRGPIVAVSAAFVVLVAVASWLIVRTVNSPLDASLHSWDPPRGDVLPVTVELRRDAGLAVTCELVAVDVRQIVVGQLELDVPAGPEEHLRVDAEIPLQGDGIAPELTGCSAASD